MNSDLSEVVYRYCYSYNGQPQETNNLKMSGFSVHVRGGQVLIITIPADSLFALHRSPALRPKPPRKSSSTSVSGFSS